ncbi:MAG: ankyrin repeat domain-containing protein [Nitrospirae bacterium]|nr:ankyrin repeat domain-containing protein [Nitrospirota bacterium]
MRLYKKHIDILFVFIVLLILAFLNACESQKHYNDLIKKRGLQNTYGAFIKEVISGNQENVELYIKSGINVNEKDDDHYTALMLAAVYGHTEIINLLIKSGADVNSISSDGNSALLCAALRGYVKTVKALIKNGADIHHANNLGITPLYALIANGDKSNSEKQSELNKTILLLIKNKADVNAIESQLGQTPLMESCFRDNYEISRALIKANAKINYQSFNGFTALMYATIFGSKDIVEMLIQNNADVSLQNNDGHNAVQLAHLLKRDEIAVILKTASNK